MVLIFSAFSHIRTEYGEILSPNARKCGKNADQNNSKYGLVLHSENFPQILRSFLEQIFWRISMGWRFCDLRLLTWYIRSLQVTIEIMFGYARLVQLLETNLSIPFLWQFLSLILVSHWLIFCYGISILCQKKKWKW